MIPQEHTEAIWPEVQAPFHVEETPSWRARSRLFRILGVVVALVGGIVSFLPFPNLPIDVPIYVLLMTPPILFGIVSSGLLRSWWAMLIVPVAFGLGFVVLTVATGGFDLQKMIESGFQGLDLDIPIFGVVSVAIGAAIGTPIGKRIEQRLQRRATAFKAATPEHAA